MVLTKRVLLRVFFAGEIIIFTALYFFGSDGIKTLVRMNRHKLALADEVGKLEQEVKELEGTIVAWKTEPFYKEQLARESLHMARKDEKVYVVS